MFSPPKICNLVPRLLHYWDILFINLANEEAKSHSKCTVHWLLCPFLTVAWAETPSLLFLSFCLPQIESAGQLNWKWWCDNAQNNVSALLAQKICVVDSLSGLGHFPYSPFIKYAFPLLLIKIFLKCWLFSFMWITFYNILLFFLLCCLFPTNEIFKNSLY